MTTFDSSPSLTAWRTLLALAVVFMMLATTGWTALQQHGDSGTPRELALTAWEKGRAGVRDLPDPHASPQRLAAFFASLSAAEHIRLADRYPLVVGNLNGAPLTLRYRANHLSIVQARDVERLRMDDKRLSDDGRQQATSRMERFESMAWDGRQILAFDPSGDGRAAEVFGDLAGARHVSVVVPGNDTNLLTFERAESRFTTPVGMAQSLYEAERAAAPRTRTAVIAWADYTSPSGFGMDAATGKLASAGAVRLTELTAALPGDSRVTLVCHSYGSVVCGVAARRHLPSRVTDVAVAGSPGMRVDSADQLHTGARVWAMRDRNDWIKDVPHLEFVGLGHGADPVSSDFGARVVSAQGAVGHSGYFEPGTESLRNFADIGVGSYGSVHCADVNDICRIGISGK